MSGPTRMRPNCVNKQIATAYWVQGAMRNQYHWCAEAKGESVTLSANGTCSSENQARAELIHACDEMEDMLTAAARIATLEAEVAVRDRALEEACKTRPLLLCNTPGAGDCRHQTAEFYMQIAREALAREQEAASGKR